MARLNVQTQALVGKTIPNPPGAGAGIAALESLKQQWASAVAGDLRLLRNGLDRVHKTLNQTQPVVDALEATDGVTGKVIAAVGPYNYQGVPTANYFSEIHVGDPTGTGDPSQAMFNANSDGTVTITNASLSITSGTIVINIDKSNFIRIHDTSNNLTATLTTGQLSVFDGTHTSTIQPTQFACANNTGVTELLSASVSAGRHVVGGIIVP